MGNHLAEFYQKFKSGSDRFTMTTGRMFAITFSFPNNGLDLTKYGVNDGAATNFKKGADAAIGFADKFGLGSGILGTGLSLLSQEIGLAENNMLRFPQEDIKWLVKGINLPNMKSADDIVLNGSNGQFGSFVMPGMGSVEPESNTFSLDMIPTVESPVENFFMPWLEEVMSMRNFANVPFRRANVFIHVYNENLFTRNSKLGKVGNVIKQAGDLFNEVNVKYTYKLSGVYPNFCDTPNLSHETAMDNRSVGFSFNKIEVFGNPIVNGVLDTIKGIPQIPGTNISGAQAVTGGRGLIDKVKRFAPGGSLS
jgi:hypothetical protein